MHAPLPRPDDVSSVNQYVELIPTSRGSKSVTTRAHPRKLAPQIRAQLLAHGGSDAVALTRAATLGQPAKLKPVRRAATPDRSASHALSAGAGAIVPRTGGSNALLVLVAVLVAITAAALGAAFRRRQH
jgi:hypothetical protein